MRDKKSEITTGIENQGRTLIGSLRRKKSRSKREKKKEIMVVGKAGLVFTFAAFMPTSAELILPRFRGLVEL